MRHRAGHAVARMRPGRESASGNGASPGMTSRPSCQRAASHCLARGSSRRNAPEVERRRPQPETEHDARGLGRRMRSDMRAGRGGCRRADCGHPARIARRGVLVRLGHRVRVAGGDEFEGAEHIELRDGDLVGHPAQIGRDPICHRGADAVSHLHAVAVDRDAAARVDLDRAERAVRAGAVILGAASHAGADDKPLLCPRLLFGALPPDRMLFQLVEDLRRADRDVFKGFPVIVRSPGFSALRRRNSIGSSGKEAAQLVDQHLQRGHRLQRPVAAHRPRGDAARMQRHAS